MGLLLEGAIWSCPRGEEWGQLRGQFCYHKVFFFRGRDACIVVQQIPT